MFWEFKPTPKLDFTYILFRLFMMSFKIAGYIDIIIDQRWELSCLEHFNCIINNIRKFDRSDILSDCYIDFLIDNKLVDSLVLSREQYDSIFHLLTHCSDQNNQLEGTFRTKTFSLDLNASFGGRTYDLGRPCKILDTEPSLEIAILPEVIVEVATLTEPSFCCGISCNIF